MAKEYGLAGAGPAGTTADPDTRTRLYEQCLEAGHFVSNLGEGRMEVLVARVQTRLAGQIRRRYFVECHTLDGSGYVETIARVTIAVIFGWGHRNLQVFQTQPGLGVLGLDDGTRQPVLLLPAYRVAGVVTLGPAPDLYDRVRFDAKLRLWTWHYQPGFLVPARSERLPPPQARRLLAGDQPAV